MFLYPNKSPEPESEPPAGWFSRERTLAAVLFAALVLLFYLCYRVAAPFLPALAWALALAIVAHPLHRRVRRWIPFANLAAGLSVFAVTLLIVAPVVLTSQHLTREAARVSARVQEEFTPEYWQRMVTENPRFEFLRRWMRHGKGSAAEENEAKAAEGPQTSEAALVAAPLSPGNADAPLDAPPVEAPEKKQESSASDITAAPIQQAATAITQSVATVVSGIIWLGMQLFVTLLALFFFLRDERQSLALLRSLLPLTEAEANDVFTHVDDTIHATIFGSLVVAMVQGGMGGLIFWWLDIPSPLLWAAIMGLLATVPLLGAFVIWGPTAIFLALRGDYSSALILAAWGTFAIGLIDNFLYPFLVGKRLHYHTFLVFLAIVGGLMFFGASGIILGPVLLAMTDVLLRIWKRRTSNGGTLENGIIGAHDGTGSFMYS